VTRPHTAVRRGEQPRLAVGDRGVKALRRGLFEPVEARVRIIRKRSLRVHLEEVPGPLGRRDCQDQRGQGYEHRPQAPDPSAFDLIVPDHARPLLQYRKFRLRLR
jgi:hypothetical protein